MPLDKENENLYAIIQKKPFPEHNASEQVFSGAAIFNRGKY
jgi:hypothetical protein